MSVFWTVVMLVVVVEVATVVVEVMVMGRARQEHAEDQGPPEDALGQSGAFWAARSALLAEEGAQVEAVIVVVIVPAMKVEVVVLGGVLVRYQWFRGGVADSKLTLRRTRLWLLLLMR